MKRRFLIELRIKDELLIKPSQVTVIRAWCHGFMTNDNLPSVIIDQVIFNPMDLVNVTDNIEAFKTVNVAAKDAYKELVRFAPLQTQMN